MDFGALLGGLASAAFADPVASLRALDRAQARDSLSKFCGLIEIPGAPVEDDDEGELIETIPTGVFNADGEEIVREVRAADLDGRPAAGRYRAPKEPEAEHHKLLIEVLEAVEDGRVPRAMFFLPPGSAKSTYASVIFPPWFMGRKPRRSVIAATYATPLARKIGRRARSIIRQPIYSEVFGPACGLSTETSAAENWSLANGNEFMGAGVLAGVTGNRADLIVIDDPIKGRAEAESETIRNRTWEEYQDSIRTRLKPGGRILMILTRWHEDDPAGRLLPKDYAGETGWVKCSDGDWWYVVNVPAQAERADDPLGRPIGHFIWPEWFARHAGGDPTNEDHWRGFKANARTWSALFQQRPAPASGTYFRREWFNGGTVDGLTFERRRWTARPEHRHTYISSDHAPAGAEDSDFQVLRVWDVDPSGDVFLVDGFRGQVTMDVLAEKARQLILKHSPLAWFPEDDNNWKAAAPFIRRYLGAPTDKKGQPLQPAYIRIEPISPHGADKAVKAMAIQGLAAMSKFWLPEGADGDAILDQYVKFPAGKHDDEVDAAGVFGRALDEAHPAIAPFSDEKKPRERYKRAKRRSNWSK